MNLGWQVSIMPSLFGARVNLSAAKSIFCVAQRVSACLAARPNGPCVRTPSELLAAFRAGEQAQAQVACPDERMKALELVRFYSHYSPSSVLKNCSSVIAIQWTASRFTVHSSGGHLARDDPYVGLCFRAAGLLKVQRSI